MKDFIEVLNRALPKIDFENEKSLVDDGLLDSLDIVSLISELSDEYDVVIPPEEISPENFNSAEDIKAMVERLLDE